MIIINSSDSDQSTNDIIDWLKYYDAKFKRINFSDKILVKNLEISENIKFELEFLESGEVIKSNEITFFWYRRGDLNINIRSEINEKEYINKENNKLKEFIYYFLVNNIPSLGNYYDNYINKLIVLSEAQNLGISTPNTLVTTDKKSLIDFIKREKNIISKGIDNSLKLTYAVEDIMIKESNDDFFYSLFQSNVEKFIELRIFFLKNDFWATAIFSQNDEKTKIDFRNYNYLKPNRLSPYKLPIWLIIKLKKLNNRLKLTSGSIDMILTKDGEYVFLEINPIGQFRNFSYFSNYNLEQIIAKYIIKNEKKSCPI